MKQEQPINSQFKTGDKVKVQDYSIAHGSTGVVMWVQQNGIIVADIGEDSAWPVYAFELEAL